MPSLRNACAEVTNTPVVSSDVTCLRSNASSLTASASRCAAERFVARISCAHSRNSCTPSATSRRASSIACALRCWRFPVSAITSSATGTTQNAASARRQS